ncbi:hypothetical protein BDV96DRAFT_645860 [Lophiotrema nucula]|uniref:Fungal N-terminal domain-containing protein n=1 Tax=Lophiotrema nucula TaxID=690887 RepID=A0A6A5ZBA0_9PLEO|nr:hypothetical protein BDV96DRAFT_645860 [Lophiotrema nucula]
MPDPLSALGGVAASLQLVEVATKTCLELYSFFHAVRGAGEDAKAQLDILDGVKTTLVEISSFIERNHTATNSPMNSDLARLSKDMQSLRDELNAIHALIPPRPHTSITAKARWVLRRKEFASRMRNLASKKTNLMISLEFLSMQDCKTLLGKADDVEFAIRNMRTDLDSVNTATQGISVSVTSLAGTFSGSQNMLRQTLNSISKDIPSEGRKTRDLISEQVGSIETKLSSHMATLKASTSGLVQLVQDVGAALPEEFSKIDTRFDDLFRMVQSSGSHSRSNTSEYAITGKFKHLMACVAREEIRKTMIPVLKDLSQSQMRNEALAVHLEHIVQDVSMRLWNNSTMDSEPDEDLDGQEEKIPSCIGSFPLPEDNASCSNHHTNQTQPDPALDRFQHIPPAKVLAASQEKIWVYWRELSWLGNIRIEMNRSKRWDRSTRRWASYVSVTVTFWPSCSLLVKKGISLFYTTEPSNNDYYQVFPNIRTFPIIPTGSPVWHYIHFGENDQLRHALENGLASPNDQDMDGYTLLHLHIIAT